MSQQNQKQRAKQNAPGRNAKNKQRALARRETDLAAHDAIRREMMRVQKEIMVKNTGQPGVQRAKIKQFNQSARGVKKLNDRSLRFFTTATDPMHDTSITLAGWPDRNIENSIVRRIAQATPITKPSIVPATDNWDCHVILNPWLNSVSFQNNTRVNNVLNQTPSPSLFHIGGLQAFGCATGTPFQYPVFGATDITEELGQIGLSADISVGVGRVVGIGIEIINTTAPLYKSGTCYAWRAPEPELIPTVYHRQFTASPFGALSPCSAVNFRFPPRTPEDALLYQGTTEWPAAEGAYVVGTFHDYQNPARMVNYTMPAMWNTSIQEDRTYSNSLAVFNTTSLYLPANVVSSTYQALPGMKLYPYNQTGIMLTGLSPQTTLSMKMNIYYESFPSIAEADLITLARPSTPYDPYVLELLAKVMRALPVAVPSKDNAEGDWWDSVLKAMSLVAPALAAVMGFEVAVPAISASLTAIRNYRNNT